MVLFWLYINTTAQRIKFATCCGGNDMTRMTKSCSLWSQPKHTSFQSPFSHGVSITYWWKNINILDFLHTVENSNLPPGFPWTSALWIILKYPNFDIRYLLVTFYSTWLFLTTSLQRYPYNNHVKQVRVRKTGPGSLSHSWLSGEFHGSVVSWTDSNSMILPFHHTFSSSSTVEKLVYFNT